jgi:ABC-type transporter MlaC component
MARAALLFLMACVAWPVAAQDTPTEEAVVARVLEAAASRSPTTEGVVRRSFDILAISGFVLGPYWAAASDDERKDFSDFLAESIALGLIRRRLAAGAEAYAITGTRRLANGDVVVASRLRLANGDTANVDWRLRGAPPLIVDVAVDGRSTAVTRRDDYLGRIRQSGGTLRSLVTALRSGPRNDP